MVTQGKKKLVIKRKPAEGAALVGKLPSTSPTQDKAPGVELDIPGFPREGRPPTVANYEGEHVLADESGEVVIRMDRGAFRLLWETMEHTALTNYRKYDTAAPAVSQASQRALRAIRKASPQYTGIEQREHRKVIIKAKKK